MYGSEITDKNRNAGILPASHARTGMSALRLTKLLLLSKKNHLAKLNIVSNLNLIPLVFSGVDKLLRVACARVPFMATSECHKIVNPTSS